MEVSTVVNEVFLPPHAKMEVTKSFRKYINLSEGNEADLKVFFCPIKKELMANPVIAADGKVMKIN